MNTPGQFMALMEPILREVFFESYKELPEQFSEVFNVNTSKKMEEHDFHVASLGPWDKFDGTVEYEDYAPGDMVTYRHETYAKGVQVPVELAEDDLYGVFGSGGAGTKRTQALARGARVRVETVAADVLNGGFTDTGYDEVSLFSSAHPLIGGGTQSNLLEEALSEGSLKAARMLMRGLVDEKGIKIQSQGNVLVVPPELEYTALELIQTDRSPYTNDNTKNVVGGQIKKIVVMDYLTDPDNWFLLDEGMHQLNFFWRVKPDFKKDEDIDHFVLKFVGRMRFSVGYSDYRGIVGSDV